ncbi:halocyanin domain-containing protein [Halegenticoccus tardaugens]|uniref:halocyanin domain-containing protein n=1 Tax=Halegenticoccus tardaugens TaxID=2071624 RepID=UPI00100BD108|nr:halocyanin domain-containing protein [Halegenticoccus tardaugens]
MTSRQTDAGQTLVRGDEKSQNDQTPRHTVSRRQLLQSASGILVIGSVAGCLGGDTRGSGGDSDGDGKTSVNEWLANTGNYESLRDLTGKTSVTVKVGDQGNAGRNAFAPAAIRITPGTTVTWNWVDGYHNVVANGGEFDSGNPEQNMTFEHTFESPGTYLYYCEPHESIGMKGAIVVEEATGGSEN